MAEVTITVDGKKIQATSGSLLIDVCKRAGIEIPSFCYYPGLSLQGACRMCLVEIAKTPKLQTACTTVVTEGMAVTTESPMVRQSRKAMLEFVLQNHPLDCPVCDPGGQCELQDATYTYGAAESRLVDIKITATNSNGPPLCTSTDRGASCATAASEYAEKEWTSGHWESPTATRPS
jgi:NADH-quinone oxidoreductase subunit G